ncbi:thioredoxin family protein [Balneolaceae bacterium ANBcel3]|nr:thioredoxin family protein [Balneolaceae bacterium ANBcel3]
MALIPSKMIETGTPAPDFSLPDPFGNIHTRDKLTGKHGLLVVFYCNHCPYVKHIRTVFSRVAGEYMKKGIGVAVINSNDAVTHPEDAPDKMAEAIAEYNYPFPYLYDETQEVARRFDAACTPDFFLYDPDLRLAYRGQFDGSRPKNEIPVTGLDLIEAMDALLSGNKPDPNQKPSIGCNIKWKPD